MQKGNKSKRIMNEFQEFVSASPVPVPKSVTEGIVSRVRSELNPSANSVFVQVALIHLVVGLLTLAFCPQFGLSFTSSMGVMHYLMKFGDSVCMLGCGAVYMGSGLFVASLLLKPEEVRVLRANRVLQISLLATLSLGAFVFFGGDVALPLGLTWALGALLGGTGLLQIGWGIRKFVTQGA